MDAIKLIWFESKKQITSFPFIITLVLLTVFSFTQMSEVFHIPVNSESDIQALDRAGERDFIDVSNTDEELKEKTSQYLEQMISAGTISDENAKEFEPVLTMLKDDNYTFDDIYLAMKDNSYIFPWLMASKSQFGNRLGTVDEVNSNIQAELGTKGYSPILMEKYITYCPRMGQPYRNEPPLHVPKGLLPCLADNQKAAQQPFQISHPALGGEAGRRF